MATHSGTCFCGAVEVTATGEPMGMGYCRCEDCRSWSAGPGNAFTLWTRNMVKVTRGSDKLGRFSKSENSVREFCTVCGGHLMTDHPVWGLTDVFTATVPMVDFAPGVHVNYASTTRHGKDGPARMQDLSGKPGRRREILPA